MVEPPKRPEPGTPEYNWLYGEGGDASEERTRKRPRPDPADDDRTRVIAASQPHRQPPAPGTPPPPPRSPIAPKTSGGSRVPGWLRPRPRWIVWALLLFVVWLVVVPLLAFQKIDTVDAFPDGDRPGDQDGTTYLIVGSDSREGLSLKERRRLGTGGGSGQRTDTIMLLHTVSGPNLLMSIPRDSLVEIPGYGVAKINGTTNPDAYRGGGPKLLVRTIEENTGIRIDHYIEIGFAGFVDVVDAVGGIEICPERKMVDPKAHLNIDKGCQEADGVTALGYARSRQTDPALGDITRARHQREVVSAVGSEAVSVWSVVNPIRYWKLNMAAPDTIRVSDGTGPIALAQFALAMTRVDGDDGLTCGVPIADLSVRWDAERSRRMFNYIIDDDTDGIPKPLCTPSGLPK